MDPEQPRAPAPRGWDGDGGTFWAQHADRFDRGVTGYREALLAAAAVGERDVVLDVGCGNGQTSLDAALRAHSGSVLGVDLSGAMLEVARTRAIAAGLTNVRFEQGNAQVHPFRSEFDLVVSRNGTMFFDDPRAAFTHVVAALRPGGRLALTVWQRYDDNEWLTAPSAAIGAPPPPPDAPGPTALGDPDLIRALLAGAGCTHVRIVPLAAPMWLGADPADALVFLTGLRAGLLAELEPPVRVAALDALRADLQRHHTAGGVCYESAAWLVTARRD